MDRIIRMLFCVGLIPYLVLVGCARDPYLSSPPSAEVLSGLGRVAVQSTSSVTNAGVDKPYTRGEAVAAGATDAISGLGGSGGGGDFGGIVIVLVPFAAVVGGTAGGMHGTPEEEAIAEWQILSDSLAKMDLQTALRRDVTAAIRKHTRITVAQSGGSGAPSSRAADSLLELSVLKAGLAGKRFENSQLKAFVTVQARLVRLSDESELYRHIWTQTGGECTYYEWASHDGRLFRKELSSACEGVAGVMVREMFHAHPTYRDTRSSEPKRLNRRYPL